MTTTGDVLKTILVAVFVGTTGLAFVVWTVWKAEDPARRVFKWLITAPVVAWMVLVVAPMVGQGGYSGAFGGVPMAAVGGLVLAIIWRHDLAAFVARPFTSLYDGGPTPPEPRPLYSVAMARQKRGEYAEAIAEVEEQLRRFPTDLEGQLLLAQIQAENLKDLPAAEATIDRLLSQPGHHPKNMAFALYSMADWCLQVAQDPSSARRHLERIVQTYPGTEFALGAAQRIAHLADRDHLLERLDPKRFAVVQGRQDLGIRAGARPAAPAEKEPGLQAAELVEHLHRHPLDTEAREQLAAIYADHYQRLDLATDQLEQMISEPNMPNRSVVHWLNMLADLQIRCGAGYEAAKATLQRIVDRDPKGAAAENARKRIDLLRLELKGKEKNQAVKLGSYEQNIGLKRGLLDKL